MGIGSYSRCYPPGKLRPGGDLTYTPNTLRRIGARIRAGSLGAELPSHRTLQPCWSSGVLVRHSVTSGGLSLATAGPAAWSHVRRPCGSPRCVEELWGIRRPGCLWKEGGPESRDLSGDRAGLGRDRPPGLRMESVSGLQRLPLSMACTCLCPHQLCQREPGGEDRLIYKLLSVAELCPHHQGLGSPRSPTST